MRVSLRAVAILILASLPVAAWAGESKSFLLMTRGEAEAIRASIRAGKPGFTALAKKLRREADRVMTLGPWSVTTHKPKDVPSLGPNDFYSEGPYWWPDPRNPGGPFVRRDGERYPGRFTANDDDMRSMSHAVHALGMAAYFFDEPRYAARASRILDFWFLDQKTRMAPHLEFGQAVRGVNTGRGTGIIDTVQLIWAVEGMLFLESSGHWKGPGAQGLREWFGTYLKWMTESAKGREEKTSGNNHSTWWTAQAAAYAYFGGDSARLRMAWTTYREFLVPHQIRPDGSCPLEEARTNSLGYSAMNLNAFSLLCRMAEVQGEDLWHYRTPTGVSVARAVAYLEPFVADPSSWKKRQISPYQRGDAWFLLLAGLGLGNQDYTDRYCRIVTRSEPPGLELELLAAGRNLCAPAMR